MLLRCVLPFVLAAAAAATAHAQVEVIRPEVKPSDVRVAIVIELTVNVEPERAEQLSAALADALHRELEVDAIGGGDVARRLPDGGVPEECVATKACVDDLAARLDVTELLFLAMVQVGADIQIDSSWVSVTTGEVTSRPRVELLADARAGEVFSAAATRLLPHARKRPLAVVVTPGEPKDTGPDRHFTMGSIIAGGVGTAFLAGGVALALSTRAEYDRCDNRDLPDTCDQGERDAIGKRALYSDLMLGAAAVGLGTAVFLYIRSDRGAPVAKESGTKATAWSVTPTPGGAFAELRVGF